MAAVLCLSYLLYGFLRPFLSAKRRREIEDEIGEDPPEHESLGDEVPYRLRRLALLPSAFGILRRLPFFAGAAGCA